MFHKTLNLLKTVKILHNVKLGTLFVFDFFSFVAVRSYVIFTGPIFVLFFSASLCVLLSAVLCTLP
jgi:hypothetical protein